MKKNIIILAILFWEVIFFLYSLLRIFFLGYFANLHLELADIPVLLSPILLLISAIGIFFNREWGTIALWATIALPLNLDEPQNFPNFPAPGSLFFAINLIFAIYLTISGQFKKSNYIEKKSNVPTIVNSKITHFLIGFLSFPLLAVGLFIIYYITTDPNVIRFFIPGTLIFWESLLIVSTMFVLLFRRFWSNKIRFVIIGMFLSALIIIILLFMLYSPFVGAF